MLWISCDMRGIDSCCKCKFLISKRTDPPIKAHWDSVLKSGWRGQYLKTIAFFLPTESCLTLNVAKIDENFLFVVCQPLSLQTFLSRVFYFFTTKLFLLSCRSCSYEETQSTINAIVFTFYPRDNSNKQEKTTLSPLQCCRHGQLFCLASNILVN